MSRRPQARIDLAALLHNLQQVRAAAPSSKVLAVLKANAYGHGLLKVAEQLKDASAFGVARIDEALMLRAGGIVKPIVLLEGFSMRTNCHKWLPVTYRWWCIIQVRLTLCWRQSSMRLSMSG